MQGNVIGAKNDRQLELKGSNWMGSFVYLSDVCASLPATKALSSCSLSFNDDGAYFIPRSPPLSVRHSRFEVVDVTLQTLEVDGPVCVLDLMTVSSHFGWRCTCNQGRCSCNQGRWDGRLLCKCSVTCE